MPDHPGPKGNTPNGNKCEHCGHECVDNCLACGAPQCCPRCCMAATTEAGDELTANLRLMLHQLIWIVVRHTP